MALEKKKITAKKRTVAEINEKIRKGDVQVLTAEEMKKLGFDTGVSTTPITPIMLGEAPLAQEFSHELFEEGVFAMAIGYPTVPQGKARIRVMISAAHERDDLGKGLDAFAKVGKKLGVIQ